MKVLLQKSVRPHVGLISLNVPDKLNALSVGVGEEFKARVEELRNVADLRAVVVTGNGSAFSAGGDLSFLEARTKTSPEANSDEMLRFYGRFLSLRDLHVPVIAAVNGAAVGAGLCLALISDIRIVAEDAKLGLNFARLGIHSGLGSSHFLPMLVGQQQATYMLLTGGLISGREAARTGLALEALPADRVVSRALEVAEEMALSSPVAVRTTLATLRAKQNVGLAQALQREADAQSLCYAHTDLLEGLAAVKTKRKPKF